MLFETRDGLNAFLTRTEGEYWQDEEDVLLDVKTRHDGFIVSLGSNMNRTPSAGAP